MTVQDIEVYHKWRNDLEVMQSTAPMLDVYHIEETEEFVTQVFLLSRPVSKQLLDIVREQVLLISCFAADSPIKYQ